MSQLSASPPPYAPGRWLHERLPLLDDRALLLLPGGPDKRPTVGKAWQSHPGFSLDQLQALQPPPDCICWHIGASTAYIAIDLDGPRAVAHCQAQGCDPLTADTWRIERTSTRERLKLVWRVTPEQHQALAAAGKTTRIGKGQHGPTDKGDEFAIFARPGTQIVVLGDHYDKTGRHDDQYVWAGRPPAQTQPLPPHWLAMVLATMARKEERPATAAAPPAPPRSMPAPMAPAAMSDSDLARWCLQQLPVLDFGDYDEWIKVGMALASIGDDSLLAAWDTWSAGDPGSYDKGACERHWRSFSPGGGIGLGSLVHQVKRRGIALPTLSPRQEPPPGWDPEPPPPPAPAPNGNGNGRSLPPDLQLAQTPDELAERNAAAASLRAAQGVTLALEDVLPAGLAGPLRRLADAYPADPLALLLPLLTLAASIVGNRCRVQVKTSWDEPFLLWGMNLAGASSGKSPMAEYLLRPMTSWAVALKEQHQAEVAAWKSQKDQAIAEAVDKKEAAAQWPIDNPPPAPARELFVVDATLEKIGSLHNGAQTVGLCSFHDELSTWFAQHQRSGRGGPDHRSNWNSLWNGRVLKVDRQTGESYLVPNTAVSVFGSTTLALYEGQLQATLKANYGVPDPDGMQARFLVCLPKAIPWRFNSLEVVVHELLLSFYKGIDSAIPDCSDNTKPTMIGFDAAALRELQPLLDALADEADTSTPARAQWLGKLRGNTVRIAGVLHVIQQSLRGMDACMPIQSETVERTARFVLWQISQYDQLQAMAGGETAGLEPAVAKLLAKGATWRERHGARPVTAREVRDWRLPGAPTDGPGLAAWLLATAGTDPGGPLGWVEQLRQGVRWHPPADA